MGVIQFVLALVFCNVITISSLMVGTILTPYLGVSMLAIAGGSTIVATLLFSAYLVATRIAPPTEEVTE